MKKLVTVIVLAAVAAFAWFLSSSAADAPVDVPCGKDSVATFTLLPAPGDGIDVIEYSAFTVGYDTVSRIPLWVAYELTDSETVGEVPRESSFSMDLDYHHPQAMREDYSNSGWDKGHMAPAADMKWSETAMKECFYLTNICPQNHSVNAGSWKTLENRCREWALKYGSMYIVTGPVKGEGKYGTIGERNVLVPDGFYKILLRKDGDSWISIAFVMGNDAQKHPMSKSFTSIDEVEKLTGLDFFRELPDSVENAVESQSDYTVWN